MFIAKYFLLFFTKCPDSEYFYVLHCIMIVPGKYMYISLIGNVKNNYFYFKAIKNAFVNKKKK